jgi:S1-C subfamily serine protease
MNSKTRTTLKLAQQRMKTSNDCDSIKTNYSDAMKVKQFIWSLFLMALLPAIVTAQTSANSGQINAPSHSSGPQQINGGEIITRGGKTYKGVVVQKVVPDGLVIGYIMADGGMGIAKLKFKDLSDNLQQQFGYNPTNAAAFDMEQKHAEGEWQAKWLADDEKAKSERQKGEIADAEGRAKWVGTGFFITDNGYLLTCFHVVTNATSIQVGTKHGLFNAELVQSDPDKDIALLKVVGTFSSLPLTSGNSVNFGEAVFTIGFPRPTVQGWEPKLTRGEISSLSGFQDDTNEYQISVPTQPGNSGGALLDEHGNVVGIIAATLAASDADLSHRIAPENVNYAIKSSGVRTFLDSVPEGWPFKLKPEYPSADRKFGDVVQAAQDAVVVVLVQ